MRPTLIVAAVVISVAWIVAAALIDVRVHWLFEVLHVGPVLVVLVPAALITYVVWRRCRYFGNTAPLLMAVLFLGLRAASPHDPDALFPLTGVVFLFVFVAGIMADLLETKPQELTAAVLMGLIAANAVWNLIGLGRIG